MNNLHPIFRDILAPFSQHNQTVPLAGIIPPRPTVTEIIRVNRALLYGDKAAIDAYADEMIRQEALREAQKLNEQLKPDSK